MRKLAILMAGLMLALALGACDGQGGGNSQGALTQTTLQLNWKPEPQFGGFYAAEQIGAYAKSRLDVTITPGGVGTPTVQMVGSGSVDFALVSADELLLAREAGNNVVALFAVYQHCPQGLMAHEERGFKEIADIFAHPGKVAMQKGLPYVRYLESKYSFENVEVVPSPGGDVSLFLRTPDYTQQVFITSEPLAAMRAGANPRTFLIADAGYDPYTTVLVVREDFLEKNPTTCKAMVMAVQAGWQAYLEDPEATNMMMHELNPAMDLETFAASADVQRPLIRTAETDASGLGTMSAERWATLGRQMVELGDLKSAPAPEACFRILW